MNKVKKIITFVTIVILGSCSQSNESITPIDGRESFIDGKTNAQQKEDYSELTFEGKMALWLSKLLQLESANLSSEHLKLISSMKEILNKVKSEDELASTAEFQQLGISLAEITPREDFIQMFARLDDYYSPSSSESLRVQATITNELTQGFTDKLNPNHSTRTNGNPDCNCDWTCGDGACTHSDCDSTSSGCGFLWLFSCNEKDELFPGDCSET